MCLYKSKTLVHRGYKVGFQNKDGNFRAYRNSYPFNEWHTVCEDNNGIRDYLGQVYPKGFHIFVNFDDAKAYAYDIGFDLYECEYIGILAEGTEYEGIDQYNNKLIHVATMIKISDKKIPLE